MTTQTSSQTGRSALGGSVGGRGTSATPQGRRNGDRQIAAALVRRRRELFWDQRDLAERMGCSQGFVSELERCRKSPTTWTLRRWAEALDCDLAVVPRSDPPAPLTDADVGLVSREVVNRRDVVRQMTAAGASARQIARRLGVSARTVTRDRGAA